MRSAQSVISLHVKPYSMKLFATLCFFLPLSCLAEDRHLSTLSSSTVSSLLPSPGDPGAEPVTPVPSFIEQDSVSMSEGSHSSSNLYRISCTVTPALHAVCVLTFRRLWRTPAGLHWQPGEGKIHHESNPRQLPPRKQLQSHPFPIVSTVL